jgi:hypothetical protein
MCRISYLIILFVALTFALTGCRDKLPAQINHIVSNIIVYNDFDRGHNSGGWAIYEWIPSKVGGVIGATHNLHPVSLEDCNGVDDSGYAWADDTRWTIDVPDSNSILPFLFYDVYKPLRRGDLRNAVVSVYLRGKGLDLKGGKVYFWVYNFKTFTRYHYIAHPLTIEQDKWGTRQTFLLDTNPTHWFHSYTSVVRPEKGEFDEVLKDVNSYGFSFRGFSSKVTGRLEMDQFCIMRAAFLNKAAE